MQLISPVVLYMNHRHLFNLLSSFIENPPGRIFLKTAYKFSFFKSTNIFRFRSTAGVVDEDYRGNLGVVMFNHSEQDFTVVKGDRIAQLICERIFYPTLEEVKSLSETERGAGGFGSTGTQ